MSAVGLDGEALVREKENACWRRERHGQELVNEARPILLVEGDSVTLTSADTGKGVPPESEETENVSLWVLKKCLYR
jgi:hypothetical protein